MPILVPNGSVQVDPGASCDENNRFWVDVTAEGHKPSYKAGIAALVLAASATDVFVITGSATKTVRVTKIRVSGISTTHLTTTIQVLKRLTADTVGTSTAPVATPLDSNDVAATATVAAYTANPTVNDATDRQIDEAYYFFGVATESPSGSIEFKYGDNGGRQLVLRGVAQQAAVNLAGVTITGGKMSIEIEWTEDPVS